MSENSIEIVKVLDGEVVYDEVLQLRECPSCGYHVARGWRHSPSCGEALEYGELPMVGTCSDVGKMGVFVCSECGRSYVPIQLSADGQVEAEWKCCPGCTAVVGNG